MVHDGFYSGVDIGGTKTHIRVARREQTHPTDRIVRTAEWRLTGNVADATSLLQLVEQVAGDRPITGLGIGAHGCDSAEDCETFETCLRSLTNYPVRVVNDAELFAPAAGLSDGIGLVAGTGSIAVGRRTDNTMLAAGGWGWILGDEGSAAGLVREAARAVRGAIDQGQPREALYDALCQSLGAASETEFGRKLDSMWGATGWGSHAAAVFAAAAAGSTLARKVIQEGASALAHLVRRVVDRGAASRSVIAAGGVIVAQPLLYALFEEELRRTVPDATPALLRTVPVAGAIVLAERLASSCGAAMVDAR